MTTMSLQGEVALVTGAGRGFGRAIALRLAAEGAAVGLVSRSGSELQAVAAAIAAAGGHALVTPADLTQPDDIARATAQVRAGLGPVSLVVSNAGVPGPFGPLWVTDPDDWWRAQSIHIHAPYLLLRQVMPDMVAAGRGRCILVSAVASRMILPGIGAYSVGKAAQSKLVAVTAAEAAETGVKLFAIDPGFVVTELAMETYRSPQARQYMPVFIDVLEQRMAREDGEADLRRCAQRVLDLASGRYDPLSGRYMELDDDIDAWLAEATAGV
ncbi:MAG TPA: SDR family oxidoreductase [Caulobacteraceae bacterium]